MAPALNNTLLETSLYSFSISFYFVFCCYCYYLIVLLHGNNGLWSNQNYIARPCLKNTKQKPTEQEQDWTVPSACQMPSPSALGVRWLRPTVRATAMTQQSRGGRTVWAKQRRQDCGQSVPVCHVLCASRRRSYRAGPSPAPQPSVSRPGLTPAPPSLVMRVSVGWHLGLAFVAVLGSAQFLCTQCVCAGI